MQFPAPSHLSVGKMAENMVGSVWSGTETEIETSIGWKLHN
jgi:hypothetical protein